MTWPVGVYDLVMSNKAFKVTVKGACWKQESQEISETGALHDDAQLLFFPLWQLICEQHGEGMHPAVIQKVLPGPRASHSPPRKWLAVAVVLGTVSPASSPIHRAV